jgi:hypothetical protein
MDHIRGHPSVNGDVITKASELIEKMEEANGLIYALPAIIEGDRGIYEAETMPVAPLLRREDGSTMRQYVYAPLERAASANQDSSRFTATTGTSKEPSNMMNIINPFEMLDVGQNTSSGGTGR